MLFDFTIDIIKVKQTLHIDKYIIQKVLKTRLIRKLNLIF